MIDESFFKEKTTILIDSLKKLEAKYEDFHNVINVFKNNSGNFCFSGIGKSRFIAEKGAASFRSIGLPSFFINAVEAFHGDLGFVRKGDLAILISKSGETSELVYLLNHLNSIGVKTISITSNSQSTMALKSDFHIDICLKSELCPLNLAPTSSSSLSMIVIDLLLSLLIEELNVSKESFVSYHPSGALGSLVNNTIDDILENDFPAVDYNQTITESILDMTSSRKGIVCVLKDSKLYGIFTDGDLRRLIREKGNGILDLKIGEYCTKNPLSVHPEMVLIDAINFMESKSITALPVVEQNSSKLLGVINIHDILKYK